MFRPHFEPLVSSSMLEIEQLDSCRSCSLAQRAGFSSSRSLEIKQLDVLLESSIELLTSYSIFI